MQEFCAVVTRSLRSVLQSYLQGNHHILFSIKGYDYLYLKDKNVHCCSLLCYRTAFSRLLCNHNEHYVLLANERFNCELSRASYM
jgi:hypothetical protein